MVPFEKAPPVASKVIDVPSGAGEPLTSTVASTKITVPTNGAVLEALSELTFHASGTAVGAGLARGLSAEHPTMTTSARRAIYGIDLFMASDPHFY